jgi:predicted nucleic acid-binding protein
VLLNEPERDRALLATKGCGLVAPASLEHEIGNALSSLLKRKSLSIADAVAVDHGFARVPIRFVPVDVPAALLVSGEERIYAYDAYFIVCAERLGLPLLTLDARLGAVAGARGIHLVEV